LPNVAEVTAAMKLLQVDINILLSDEVIQLKMQQYEEEIAQQGKQLVIRHRNPVIQAEMDTMKELQRNRDREGAVGGFLSGF
jgi:hypothetical protein